MTKPRSPAFDVFLSDLVAADQIVEGMKAKTVKKAVEELVDRLAKLKLVSSKATAVKRIMERERLAPTALGSGVAIPHARMDVGEKPVFAIGRHDEGIDFGALDGKPVRLIFLLIWQPERPGLFNQVFANLVAKLNKETFRKQLLAAEGPSELRALLKGVRIELLSSAATTLDGTMLTALQHLEAVGQATSAQDRKIALIRQDLDSSILWRYDRLKKLHGMAVVSAEGGACGGCSMQLSHGMYSEILKNPHLLFVCERCGRFVMGDVSES